jgi:hypothetical protein
MSSHDGLHFDKCDEALFTPGPEHHENWVYGKCYPAYFLKETTGDEGVREISMLVGQYYKQHYCDSVRPDEFVRYTLRLDGFAYYNAPFKGAKVVTKPFVLEGDKLTLNFASSAKGGVVVTVKDDEGRYATSYEIFGDSDEKTVRFKDGSLADFVGKTVWLEFDMKDAKLYAFKVS